MDSANQKKIIIIGPAHPLRGGLASYNERLAKEFQQQGHVVSIYTFCLQYPSFLFPGTTQYSKEPPPSELDIRVCINSINPLNWFIIGNRIRKERPDLIVVRFWLPFMGPCLGTILRRVKKNKHTRIVCIADNIFPHEKRFGDKPFTHYFIKSIDAFITMSEKVLSDLRTVEKNKPAKFVAHPLYDNFGGILPKEIAREKLGIQLDLKILLFFGFIRNYKGLDILLEAMHILKEKNLPQTSKIRLLIAGEFYEDRKMYDDQIARLDLKNLLILHTDFIPDSEVKYYLCAADVVVQPYRSATQSGVTPLAYHFEKPMIITNVGGLPSMVPDGKVGLVTPPTAAAIVEKIIAYFDIGEAHFLPGLREEKKKYSWARMTETIFAIANCK